MAVNLASLVNFGGGENVGDVVYSAYPLSAPAYLPLNNEGATYLNSSYPVLAAIYADKTVSYSTTTGAVPAYYKFLYSGKTFLGFNAGGANFATSSDVVNWNSLVVPTPSFDNTNRGYNRFGEIAYGNGKIVAIYYPNASLITTVQNAPYYGTYNWGASIVSSDGGLTWQFGNLNPLIPYTGNQESRWVKLIFTGSYFVATQQSSSGSNYTMVATSSDGISWSDPSPLGSTPYPNFTNTLLIPGNSGGFVFLGSESTYGRIGIFGSAGTGFGVTNRTFISGTYGAGLFVVLCNNDMGAGAGNSTNTYFTSPTGITWTARTMPATLFWQSIAYANGYFLAIGSSNSGITNTAYTSTDGINWAAQPVPNIGQGSNGTIGSIAGGQGKFLYYNSGTNNAVTVNLGTAGTTFSLPYYRPMQGAMPYIKAT